MNTPIKIAAGFAITAAGLFALSFLRKTKNAEAQKSLNRKNATERKERKSQEKIYRKKESQNFITDRENPPFNAQSPANHYNGPVQKPQHHQTGMRHH